MEALHGIGGIDHPSDRPRVLEVLGELLPIVLPGFNDHRVFASPFLLKSQQGIFSQLFTGGPVDGFQIPHKLLLILRGDILQGIADLDNALLNLGLGKDAHNGLGKASEVIGAGNQDILQTPVTQVGKDL